MEELTSDDMSIVPLIRASAFSVRGRPFYAFPTLNDTELADIRSPAAALARIMGHAAPIASTTTIPGTKWL